MKHAEIIQALIDKNDYQSYLEIGCRDDHTFNAVQIAHKVGVDPEKGGTHKMTSDEFFAQNTEKFDIIFIDGDHREEQVYKDIVNAMNTIAQNGIIVVHDLLPSSEVMQAVPRQQKIWTGDGWKAFVKLRQRRRSWEMCVIDTDYGVGLIRKGTGLMLNKFPETELTWQNFVQAKNVWMNTISVGNFKNNWL